MERPPPLGRIYALYFRGLLALTAAALLLAILAIQFNWPIPQGLAAYLREQGTLRSTAKPASH